MRARTPYNLPTRPLAAIMLSAMLLLSSLSFAQESSSNTTSSSSHQTSASRVYPKEIRGYKVELADVELKQKSGKAGTDSSDVTKSDALIKLGEPRVVGLTPFGITLEVPVTVSAVKQGGRVDFLTFEDMTVNGNSVTVDEYRHSFDLPNDGPKTLSEPISIYVSTPQVVLGVFGEWTQSKEVWPITGRAYVFGRFKKFLFKFKRVVPVELNLTFRNPLK